MYTKQALKDAKKLSSSGLRDKAEAILEIIKEDPFKPPLRLKGLLATYMGHIPGELIFNIGLFIKS